MQAIQFVTELFNKVDATVVSISEGTAKLTYTDEVAEYVKVVTALSTYYLHKGDGCYKYSYLYRGYNQMVNGRSHLVAIQSLNDYRVDWAAGRLGNKAY
jgi:hypothetical protein